MNRDALAKDCKSRNYNPVDYFSVFFRNTTGCHPITRRSIVIGECTETKVFTGDFRRLLIAIDTISS